MLKNKDGYLRLGWFVMAATVVAVVLASTLNAPLIALIIIGVIGLTGGVALVIMGSKR